MDGKRNIREHVIFIGRLPESTLEFIAHGFTQLNGQTRKEMKIRKPESKQVNHIYQHYL